MRSKAEKLTLKGRPQLSCAQRSTANTDRRQVTHTSSLVHDNDTPSLFSKMHLEPYKYRPPLPQASALLSTRISLHPTPSPHSLKCSALLPYLLSLFLSSLTSLLSLFYAMTLRNRITLSRFVHHLSVLNRLSEPFSCSLTLNITRGINN
jgi:hypothetical protein